MLGGSGAAQLAPPWSREQVQWLGHGYFVLRLATEEVSRWLLGADYEWSAVFAHERTFRRSAADKASVMKNLSMNPWPSHLACESDPNQWRDTLSRAVNQTKPELDTGHLTLWRLSKLPSELQLVGPFIVLDGHHSRKAQQHLRLKSLFGWLEPLASPSLQVRAIHRAGWLAEWLEQCLADGDLRVCAQAVDEKQWSMDRSMVFEAVQADRRRWLEVARHLPGETVIDALARLAKGRVRLKASANLDEILSWLKDMEIDTALRLPAPTKDYVWERALKRELFPQKATYFFPKVPFGLLVSDIYK